MKSIDVYYRCYEAEAEIDGMPMHAAEIALRSDYEDGHIAYTARLIFFAHNEPGDFTIPFAPCFEKELYSGKGRRSRKREAALREAQFEAAVNELAAEAGGKLFWDKPLTDAKID